MTGYAKKFEFNLIMSFKNSNKELFKKCDQIWKRIEKLLKIKFDSKPLSGDDEKCINKKHAVIVLLQIFITKYAKRKHSLQVFINNNARFCY